MDPSQPPSPMVQKYLQTKISKKNVYVMEYLKNSPKLRFFIISPNEDIEAPSEFKKNSIIQFLDNGEKIHTGKQLSKMHGSIDMLENIYSNSALSYDLFYSVNSYIVPTTSIPHYLKYKGKIFEFKQIFDKILSPDGKNCDYLNIGSYLELQKKANQFLTQVFNKQQDHSNEKSV